VRRGRRRRGPVPDRPLCVLLLPDRLERMAAREHAEELLRAPGAVAVEPATLGYGATGRMPGLIRERVALGQARRMALPGQPLAVVAYDATQYPLARALLALHDAAELWYGGSGEGDLHDAATTRAALTFSGRDHRPLFERMEALGIESGRLGSERI
jgi:hypothetical protein